MSVVSEKTKRRLVNSSLKRLILDKICVIEQTPYPRPYWDEARLSLGNSSYANTTHIVPISISPKVQVRCGPLPIGIVHVF